MIRLRYHSLRLFFFLLRDIFGLLLLDKLFDLWLLLHRFLLRLHLLSLFLLFKVCQCLLLCLELRFWQVWLVVIIDWRGKRLPFFLALNVLVKRRRLNLFLHNGFSLWGFCYVLLLSLGLFVFERLGWIASSEIDFHLFTHEFLFLRWHLSFIQL